MKRIKIDFSTFLSAILMLSLMGMFASCSDSDSDDNSKRPGFGNSEETMELTVTVLSGKPGRNDVYPHTMVSTGDWRIIELWSQDTEYDRLTTFQFLNPKENVATVVSGYGDQLMMYDYDPVTCKKSNKILLAAESDGEMKVAICRIDWDSNSLERLSETVFSSNPRNHSRRDAYMDDIRQMVFDRLSRLSDNISNLDDYTSDFSKSAGLVCKIWTKVAIPLAQLNLYSGEEQKELAHEMFEAEGRSYVVSLMPALMQDVLEVVTDGYNFFADVAHSLKSYFTEDDVYDSFNTINVFSNAIDVHLSEYAGESIKFRLHGGATCITETSADLYTNISYDGSLGYISSMGYEVTGSDGYSKNISVDDLERTVTLKGLTPGATYNVCAYLVWSGIRYESRFSFETESNFSLHPDNLAFELKGGEKVVALQIDPESLKSWEITEKPSWCKIEKSATSFWVKVEKSSKVRSGVIVVTATLSGGAKVSASMSVTQGDDWNGTAWDFSGKVTTTVNGHTETGDMNFGMEIRSVEGNDFTFTGDMSEFNGMASIKYGSDGELIFSVNERINVEAGYVDYKFKMTFTRTGRTVAKCSLSGDASVHFSDGYGNYDVKEKMSGSFNGTLVE